MNGWLLDTNVLSELLRPAPNPHVISWMDDQDPARLFISVLVIGEFAKGIAAMPADNAKRNLLLNGLRHIEARFDGRILPVCHAVARRWGWISGELKLSSGRFPPPIDALLASTAWIHQLCLVTRNVKDMEGAGVPLLNPFEASD